MRVSMVDQLLTSIADAGRELLRNRLGRPTGARRRQRQDEGQGAQVLEQGTAGSVGHGLPRGDGSSCVRPAKT